MTQQIIVLITLAEVYYAEDVVRDGKIAEVEVYLGWTVPHGVPPGEHRAPE